MKQHISITALFLAAALTVGAQNKKNEKTKNLPSTPSKDVSSEDIENRLVEMALANPDMKVREYETVRSKAQLTKAKAEWLNYVMASANINDVTTGRYRNSNNDYRAQVYYPLWNIGIRVPLGTLIQNGQDVKVAKANVHISDANEESARRQFRAMILSKYHTWLTTKQKLAMQAEITEDDFAAFTQAESKLAAGSISYESYTSASQQYNNDRTKKMDLEVEVSNLKYEIEALIGAKLETVISQ